MGVDSYVVVVGSVVTGQDGHVTGYVTGYMTGYVTGEDGYVTGDDGYVSGRHGNVRESLQVEGEEVRVEKRRMEK